MREPGLSRPRARGGRATETPRCDDAFGSTSREPCGGRNGEPRSQTSRTYAHNDRRHLVLAGQRAQLALPSLYDNRATVLALLAHQRDTPVPRHVEPRVAAAQLVEAHENLLPPRD